MIDAISGECKSCILVRQKNDAKKKNFYALLGASELTQFAPTVPILHHWACEFMRGLNKSQFRVILCRLSPQKGWFSLNFDRLDFAQTHYLHSKIRLTAMAQSEGKTITVGVTGASGAIYAQTILRVLDADSRVSHVYVVASDAGLRLISTELGIVAPDAKKLASLLTGTPAKKFECLPNKDIGASIASGSAAVDSMVVIPCSAGALGSIASGVSDDLITRAADVCLKERRKLVLCLRETPLNRIHIENMLRLHDAGALVMPATPAFYYAPKSIDDVVEQFVFRVLAHLDLPHDEQYHWQGGKHGK